MNSVLSELTRLFAHLPEDEVYHCRMETAEGEFVQSNWAWIPAGEEWRTPQVLYRGNREFRRVGESLIYREASSGGEAAICTECKGGKTVWRGIGTPDCMAVICPHCDGSGSSLKEASSGGEAVKSGCAIYGDECVFEALADAPVVWNSSGGEAGDG